MEKTILTSKQSQFLKLVQVEQQITKWFYLTGGTALSEFYLKHRLSEDLDFFCETKEVNQKLIEAYLKKVSKSLSVKEIKRSVFMGLSSYFLIYEDGDSLKVDFNYYPFPRIEKGLKKGSMQVDSVRDIASNKVHTIFTKPRDRDYVDLYFIMKNNNFELGQLILDAKLKFDWHIDRLTFASQLLRVADIKVLESPKILTPFNQNAMNDFFIFEAEKLKKQILR